MTEEFPLQEESAPSSEPLTTSGIPASDKKRVLIGAGIGGGIFIAVLIAIIVLVTTEKHDLVVPPPKPNVLPHHNPYFVEGYDRHEKFHKVTLKNKRRELENMTIINPSENTTIPIVIETPENHEPEELEVYVLEYDEHLARITYLDAQLPRWHVPYFGNHSDPYAHASRYTHNPSGFHIKDGINDSFQWYYDSHINNLSHLITTYDCRLQYFDKYLEFEALLEKDYIYGMGERIESFQLKNDNYSLWNRHMPSNHKSDTEIGMYGSHPFILNRLTNNRKHDFIGIFMRNSNAMLFSMWGHSSHGAFINYKMIGGVIDLYIFHTADPQYIIRKYHSVIGRPYLPPLWAMGFHQAREKYTLADLKRVTEECRKNFIPVDALWADTELNENSRTFTVNKGSFDGIKDFVSLLHDDKQGYDMHFVAIANPGLAKDDSYKYYSQAIAENCVIFSTRDPTEHPFEGKTAAGTSVFLDFFVYNSTLIWGIGLHDLFELTLFDGIWLSENEITHLCNGECVGSGTSADEEPRIPNPLHNNSEFNYIPYRPTIDYLDTETLPMTAYHHGGDMFHKQYFTHNLYSIQIAQATYEGLRGVFENKRFFIASRSTWPGSGQFASHWLDGNSATWESMESSIASILNFNMFGIPHVGAPIGGYYFDPPEEEGKDLLVRWYELGAFYPLMLSYSASNTKPKEPFASNEIMPYIIEALHHRYGLIRFMYTKMFEAYLWGGAVVHPLFFDFTNDTQVYKREILDKTFMWASTLYVIPSLIGNQATVKAYLPNWNWYDIRTLEMILDYSPFLDDGKYLDLEQPLGQINVLLKGGTILTYQHLTREGKISNTKDLDTIPSRLIVAPDHEGKAVGSMIVDSIGIQPYPDPKSNTYRHYTFTYMNQIFRINKLGGFDFHEDYLYDEFWELLILEAARTMPDYVCMMDTNLKKKELIFVQSHGGNALIIQDEGHRRMPMKNLEAIVWGSNSQHDFCRYRVHIEDLKLSSDGRVMEGKMATSDPSSYQLHYDLYAAALCDHIAYLSITKTEPNVVEWKVPDVVSDEFKRNLRGTKSLDAIGFGVSHPNQDFFFEMSEEYDPHDFLLSSRNQPFVYLRNFIQIKFVAAGKHIFGLGERVGKFELADGIYSIWNYDFMHEETGQLPGNNVYGSHPFYMIHTHNPYDFAGVFFLTSNPMDVRIKHIAMQTEIDHILSGGIIEIFLIGKGSAEHVVREYHSIIGKPHPLPFWAFGYHQSRWGYRDMEHLQLMVKRFEEENIPLDGIWMDKDFMDKYKSFTIEKDKWHNLNDFVKQLHAKNKHFVAIVDAGIAVDDKYEVYNEGAKVDTYIKSSFTNEALLGITWAGYSVWVDFLHPSAGHFWENTLMNFYKLVEFDALWLDMNEPSNFCDGECPDKMNYHYYYFPLDYYDDLYYNPTHRPLEARTISMEALHHGDKRIATEFNYHSMYGYYQSKITANFFLDKLNKRPFVISSSTFPGSGRYASHWLGDNYSTWTDMEYSIAGMIHFSMFGIPFVGANICGYSGNATDRMCARWMQLGAFYPFMRNHNSPEGSPQEPYINETVKIASKHAILTRYSLVRYIYSEYMHTVIRGGTLIKPLTFIFPEDNDTYTTVDTSFMLGPALRVTPILEGDKDEVMTYFPNADWYSIRGPEYVRVLAYDSVKHKGQRIPVHSGLSGDTLGVHIRFGTIIPVQEVQEGIQNVLELHNRTINLLVVPNFAKHAFGEVFYDTEHHRNFNVDHQDIEMQLYHSQIQFHLVSGRDSIDYNYADMYIDKIIILGAGTYNNTISAKYVTHSNETVNMKKPVYNANHKTLTLQVDKPETMNILKLRRVFWESGT